MLISLCKICFNLIFICFSLPKNNRSNRDHSWVGELFDDCRETKSSYSIIKVYWQTLCQHKLSEKTWSWPRRPVLVDLERTKKSCWKWKGLRYNNNNNKLFPGDTNRSIMDFIQSFLKAKCCTREDSIRTCGPFSNASFSGGWIITITPNADLYFIFLKENKKEKKISEVKKTEENSWTPFILTQKIKFAIQKFD